MSDLVIGVDGGGTKTVAWLAPLVDDEVDRVLGRGLAGPGNPQAAGFAAAQANLEEAIARAFADAGLARSTVRSACFGLAGAGRGEEQSQIAAWARQQGIAPLVRVSGDAEPILAAASPENRGIVLICGTGSLAWGRSESGETGRTGGWGYLIGDEGSGYAIALAGLRLAVRSADGREPATQLLDRFLALLGAAAPEDLIGRVYSPQMTRERIASLAVAVFAAAAEHDELALRVIGDAAIDLATMVAVLARRLKFKEGDYPLAVAGSAILNAPALQAAMLKGLKSREASPESIVPVAEPVRGAVVLARQLVAGT
jgi:N-acetylglucosamine kinase-like BadF-type ATPase